MFRLDYSFTVNNDFVTLDGNNFTGIFVYKSSIHVFNTRAANLRPTIFLRFVLFTFTSSAKLKSRECPCHSQIRGSQQSGNRQFLLTVNVRIHDVVDVGGKLNPRTLERDDTG